MLLADSHIRIWVQKKNYFLFYPSCTLKLALQFKIKSGGMISIQAQHR